MDGLGLLVGGALAPNLALQLLKPPAHPLANAPLALALALLARRPSDTTSTLALALSALLALALNGSQSNHVLVETLLLAALLLTAPLTSEPAARREWSRRLALACRALLCVLYAAAAVAKLNADFFEPRTSCAVLMLGAALGRFMPASRPLLLLVPFGGVAFEMALALLIGGAHALRPSLRRAVLRGCVALGGGFHLMMALPPPPLSAYPFTMLMVPLYAAVIPDELEQAARALNCLKPSTRRGLVCALAAALLAAHLGRQQRFEYPSYLSWEVGNTWLLCSFGALAAVAAAPCGGAAAEDASAHGKRPVAWALAPAACLAAISLLPYLGVRTHPAFIMFSNLRLEHRSNHWLGGERLAPWGAALTSGGFHARNAVEILDTDLPSLRALQVDLAPMLPTDALATLERINATAAFYISPPTWGAPASPWRGGVAVAELQRRVAEAVHRGEPRSFFVKYRRLGESGGLGGGVSVYRRRAGARGRGSDASLEVGVAWWRAALHRFRPFSVGGPEFCRH